MKTTLQQKFVGASRLLVAAAAVAVLALGAVGARADGADFHKSYTGHFGDTSAPYGRDVVLFADTGSVVLSTGQMVPQDDGSVQIGGVATISEGNQTTLAMWTGSLTLTPDGTTLLFSASFQQVDQDGNLLAGGASGSFSGTIDAGSGEMTMELDEIAV